VITNAEIVGRLFLAAVLGSLIGLERERLLWAAGLRTHMLVGVGAALIMLVSAFGFFDILGHQDVTLDPSRVAAQVVSGIGFLGAGTILMRREVIRGLTTAASLWSVAAIGLAVGGGLYVAAISTTLLILLILVGLKPLEMRWRQRVNAKGELHLICERERVSVSALEDALAPVPATELRIDRGENAGEDAIHVALPPISRVVLLGVVERVRCLDGVRSVKLESALGESDSSSVESGIAS
jgi:putative Mg2+ transporter-C (MgtC) family protein